VTRCAGCRPGDRVCMLVRKSPTALVGILGTLKAHAAYVPIDTASPAPRTAKMIRQCEPRIVLIDRNSAGLAAALAREEAFTPATRIGWLDGDPAAGVPEPDFTLADAAAASDAPLPASRSSLAPAYILFTSGSTGTPKGVTIAHQNVIHFVEWATRYFGIRPGDRLSGHAPLHFDLSTLDIFGAFAAGAFAF
jgi:non-ribosomal peptide synthetase component F